MRLRFSAKGNKKGTVLVLGMFDGVHAGHAWLMRTAKQRGAEEGLPVVACTFFPHPLELVDKKRTPPMLTTVTERASRLCQLGIDEMVVWAFTKEMRDMSPKKFVKRLVKKMKPKHIVVGFNYTFGRGGKGTPKLLKKLGKKFGFTLSIVPPVEMRGTAVSSTRIRNLLEQGDVEYAGELLERPYSVKGKVEKGKKLGRVMGFPTANIHIPKGKAMPCGGVYIARVKTAEGLYPAVVNLGHQPTLPSGRATLEAHLMGFQGELYGQKAQVHFCKRLRDEETFPNMEALQAQIAKDVQQAKQYFYTAHQ